MRILVTGGAGFIGSALVRRAVAKGHHVLNIDKLTYAGTAETVSSVCDRPNYSFLHADVVDGPVMANAFTDFAPDVAIHLAAETHVDRAIDSPAAFIETNIRGTYIVLEAALRYFSKVDAARRERFRIVIVSTDEVYGSLGESGRFEEDSPYRPNSPYSASKAAGDLLTGAWHSTYRLPTIISNCTNNYGPFQHPEKLIPTIIRNALADQAIPIYGKGDNRRDWLYVEDHVDGLLKILDRGLPGESYIFGSGVDWPNIKLASMICALLDARRPSSRGTHGRLITMVADRPGHDYRYAVNPAKAWTALGWLAKTSLEDGLAETIDWYLSNPEWLTRDGQGLGRLGLMHMSGGA